MSLSNDEKALAMEVDKNVHLWHCRLGHVGESALHKLDVVFNEEMFLGQKLDDANFILEKNLPCNKILGETEDVAPIFRKVGDTKDITNQVPAFPNLAPQVQGGDSSFEVEVIPLQPIDVDLDQFEHTVVQGAENLILDILQPTIRRYPLREQRSSLKVKENAKS
ncbi:hypothetical protein R1flu_010271 [Riccia fluitans]|uniref:GAG-pre-integrase domain-containing protein n=1 Tax=Riccia fluitans TaxID=41844 RepID=A0ABD1Z5L6_9MARC